MDWRFFYVNIFVDRDMLMQFRGGGIGHKSTHESTAVFLEDHDPLDEIAQDDSEEGSDSGIDQANDPVDGSTSMVQNQATGDEDEEDIESEMDEYGYEGISKEEDMTDEEGAKEQADGPEEANDEVRLEDGEDDALNEYEGYVEL
ncbi:hypothetical protein EDD22DRAFT_947850 [Suillus occidentalis]|nr:hypothetical protein EDD22DRAFT_947850 [Suillus occidentalis]